MIKDYKEFLNFIQNLDHKPTLLLHTCCAPCSTHTINVLKDYFDITIFYSNSNIAPETEFMKRLDEQIRYAKKFNINVIEDTYNFNEYLDKIKGHEHDGEKSKRCYLCYELRLDHTAKLAKEKGFEYFTTSLSISPYKVERWINEIGYKLESIYGINYLYSNFKKDNGYKDSIKISNEEGMYRQDYCGCPFSKMEREERLKG
jgi:epoxyqueuosine reductase